MITLTHQGKQYINCDIDTLTKDGVPNDVIEQAQIDEKWKPIKIQRDRLLAETDYTQVSDSPLTDAKKTKFATYRQALRDLPQSKNNPEDISWPVKPA